MGLFSWRSRNVVSEPQLVVASTDRLHRPQHHRACRGRAAAVAEHNRARDLPVDERHRAAEYCRWPSPRNDPAAQMSAGKSASLHRRYRSPSPEEGGDPLDNPVVARRMTRSGAGTRRRLGHPLRTFQAKIDGRLHVLASRRDTDRRAHLNAGIGREVEANQSDGVASCRKPEAVVSRAGRGIATAPHRPEQDGDEPGAGLAVSRAGHRYTMRAGSITSA